MSVDGERRTLIAGGTIVDGTGRPGFAGDVVVEGDRVKDVGGVIIPADLYTLLCSTGLCYPAI